jgi:DNA-binding beta-propeller fold protein YncE
MKYLAILLFCALAHTTIAQLPNQKRLPNGWKLSPVGRSFPLGDLPLNIAVSKSKKYMAVTNNGQSVQSIQLIDPKTERILNTVTIPKSWYGLKFSGDEKFLYASGGNDNWILKYAIVKNKLVLSDSIKLGDKWPVKISPTGIDIDDAKQEMNVVTKENNSLYVINLKTKQVTLQVELGSEAYTCVLSPDKKDLYISLWGKDQIMVWNAETQSKKQWAAGDNPNEICLTKNGQFLFVSNANDNSVSVIDTREGRTVETLNAALYPNAPSGSTSNAVALSPDEKILYIANADNNCLAVFDVSKPGSSFSKGFIPTGWYPTNIKVIGKKIFVSNGKGFSSMANPYGPSPYRPRQQVNYRQGDTSRPKEVQYIGGLFKGTMSVIDMPDDNTQAIWSKAVYANTPYTKAGESLSAGETGNPIPMRLGDPSPIKYVFYIIKENRTYDQVLGDVKGGNGDTSLLLFGEHATPNQHALVNEFVLLDNFYVDAEVSADGHNWSMGAYATDYLEKTWPTSYGGRGGDYDGEGKREIANDKNGFIWGACKLSGVSYRTYGEFADKDQATIPVLKDHYSPTYAGWDLGIRDTTRYYAWQKEFDSLVAVNAVPHFNTLRMGNDHTEGLKPGSASPFAHVADNDLAVGMFVEHLSQSPIWKESVVFILEDDAQNGPDHVDAHRSTAYVAGGYVKRNYIEHEMYSTSSLLRTIELILGIKPMSQYDAAATPMWKCFSPTASLTPFKSRPANIDLTLKNPDKSSALARKSMSFDFTREDSAPDLEFNEIIWKAVRGEHSVMPAPQRAAFIKVEAD